MKKIIFITLLLAGSLASKSQQLIIGKGIKFILPNEAVHLNKDQSDTFAKENGYIAPSSHMTIYKFGNMLLNYRDTSRKYSLNSLEKFKKSRDDFNTKGESGLSPDHYTSYIKTYTHCRVAVNRIGDSSSDGTYFFYAVNKEETWYILGSMQYGKGDLSKADAFLTDLLNSLEFTK